MVFGKQVFDFIEKNKIGQPGIDSITNFAYIDFSKDDFLFLQQKNLIFNGENGGLVIGKLHIEGGIHLLQPQENSNYRYVGEMEGWEYLTSPLKNELIFEKIKQISDSNPKSENYPHEEFVIPNECNVINTSGSEIAFLLISKATHFIINRFATKMYIQELMELDKLNNQH